MHASDKYVQMGGLDDVVVPSRAQPELAARIPGKATGSQARATCGHSAAPCGASIQPKKL